MSLNLFSQTLALVLCAAGAVLATYLLLQFPTEWHAKYLPFIVGAMLVAAVLLQVFIGAVTRAAEDLPAKLWLILVPFTGSVSLVAGIFVSRLGLPKPKHPKRKARTYRRTSIRLYTAGGALIACSFLLSGAIVNDYYQYFPNLYSLVGDDQAVAGTSKVDLQYSSNSAQSRSIEASLTSSSHQTTGRVFAATIPAPASHFNARRAWVYEPAIALTDSYIQLPVLVLLAGVPGSPQDWLAGGGAQATLDAFAKDHDGITPLVFMVDDTGTFANDTECVDSKHGNVETYLTTDVPHYIKSHFNVSSDPSHWAVGGLSMGGTCGVMLALRHPGTYHYFLDFGGDLGPDIGSPEATTAGLFGGSKTAWAAHQPSLLLTARGARKTYADVGGFFAVGKDDAVNVTVSTRQLYMLARGDNLDVAYETVSGQHTFGVWKQNFSDALPWLSNRLGATECSTGC